MTDPAATATDAQKLAAFEWLRMWSLSATSSNSEHAAVMLYEVAQLRARVAELERENALLRETVHSACNLPPR